MSLGWSLFVLVVYVLALARVVRLINHDHVLDAMHVAVERRVLDTERSAPERIRWSKLGDFLKCPWCVGFWLAAGTAWIPVLAVEHAWRPDWTWSIPVALAVSHLIGMQNPLVAEKRTIVMDDDENDEGN